MEGKYLTKDQRVTMAQQIRKTHFILGGGCKSFNTTSQNFLKAPEVPSTSQFQANLSKDLRKTHLLIGNDTSKKASEFTVSYPPKEAERPEKPKIDLKKHNAVLGTTGIAYKTETSANYKPGYVSIQDVKSAKAIERNLRGHHFDLGTDGPTQKSTFGADFVQKPSERAQEVIDLKNDLRKSHFTLGRGPKMLKSTSQQQFVPYPSTSSLTHRDPNLRKEHFQLGIESQALSSTHRQFFTVKSQGKQDLNSEKLADLRNSHFVLGKNQANYSTSSLLSKPQTARPELQKDLVGLNIRSTHFQLGSDPANFQTSYIGNSKTPVVPLTVDKSDSQRHLSSNISFGSGKFPQTSSQASFKHPNPKDIEKPDPNLVRELRSHHFKLGTAGNQFKTTASEFGKKNGEPGQFDESRRQDLRASHFKIGDKNVHFLSTNKNDFVKYDGSGSVADPNLAKNLRKTHFTVGADKGQWLTEHRTNFNWIQPVADNEFKITLI